MEGVDASVQAMGVRREREDREATPRWTDQQARRETGQVRGKVREEPRT